VSESTYEIEVEIRNPEGLHMRPAMQFVDVANRFGAAIAVRNQDTTVDGKSIMQMTMLAATSGTKLTIQAKGEDAREAITALQELVDQNFSTIPPPSSVGKKDSV